MAAVPEESVPDWMKGAKVDGIDDSVNMGRDEFKSTPELEAHIKNIDTTVPRKRGIGGAHNSTEFYKNNVKVISEIPSKIPGVKSVEYKMPKLNAD